MLPMKMMRKQNTSLDNARDEFVKQKNVLSISELCIFESVQKISNSN